MDKYEVKITDNALSATLQMKHRLLLPMCFTELLIFTKN